MDGGIDMDHPKHDYTPWTLLAATCRMLHSERIIPGPLRLIGGLEFEDAVAAVRGVEVVAAQQGNVVDALVPGDVDVVGKENPLPQPPPV